MSEPLLVPHSYGSVHGHGISLYCTVYCLRLKPVVWIPFMTCGNAEVMDTHLVQFIVSKI